MQKIQKNSFTNFDLAARKFSNSSFQNLKMKKNFLNVVSSEKNQNALHSLTDQMVFLNYPFDKGRLKTIVCWFFEKHGQYKTLKFLEKLKEFGFGFATTAGISLGIDDLRIPNQKISLLATAETKVAKDFSDYRNAKITGIERVQRLIYTWNQTNDTLKQEVVQHFEKTDLLNPIYMMAFSGARGNMSQVRQLVGMRGLMSDPQGQIIDFPIQSNFREGLTLTEYLISTYGARKGIVDTALRTATAGYLTRRLVDVAQHTIVSHFDCGTMRGIFLFDMKEGKKTIYSFQNRLIGRVLAQNIQSKLLVKGLSSSPQRLAGSAKQSEKDTHEQKHIAFRNQEIDSKFAKAIANVTKKAFVRSPLTCETSRFVCQLCYGWSFSHGKLVSVGEAVGIIAAQSIGEPGTQLTMRTFHTGGVFAGGLTDQILAPFPGKIQYFQSIPGSCVRTSLSEIAFFTKMPGLFLVQKKERTVSVHSFGKTEGANSLLLQTGNTGSKQTSGFSFSEQITETNEKFYSAFGPTDELKKKSKHEKKNSNFSEVFRIPAYALLFCRNNEFVQKKQVLAQFSSVLKKVQYGSAEQTLFSTFPGEFVFGNSFFAQKKKFCRTEFDSVEVLEKNRNGNLKMKQRHNLLLEQRNGDFSEFEFKYDSLWKSQNWSTIWILSGKIFYNSFDTKFWIQEGDSLKKTSVLNRVLWKKTKKFQYFLIPSKNDFLFSFSSFFTKEQSSASKKNKKNLPYLFSFEKSKKFQSCFGSLQRSQQQKVSFQKFFSFCSQVQAKSEKTNDIVFFQNKSNRFFTNFDLLQNKIEFPFHSSKQQFDQQNKKVYNFLRSANLSPLKQKIQNDSILSAKNSLNFVFFKFSKKRKKEIYSSFLNSFVYANLFKTSRKFGFFSFESKKNSLLLFSNQQKAFQIKKYTQKLQNFSNLQFSISQKNEKLLKQKVAFQTLLSLNSLFPFPFVLCPSDSQSATLFPMLQIRQSESQFVKKPKQKKFFSAVQTFKNQQLGQGGNRSKNIFLKKTLFRLSVEKIRYQKFGYTSSFVSFGLGTSKKIENFQTSFRTFSTLKQNEKSFEQNKNLGKTQNELSFVNENFFGKEFPTFFSYSFFQNFQTKTSGLFSIFSFKNVHGLQNFLFSQNLKNYLFETSKKNFVFKQVNQTNEQFLRTMFSKKSGFALNAVLLNGKDEIQNGFPQNSYFQEILNFSEEQTKFLNAVFVTKVGESDFKNEKKRMKIFCASVLKNMVPFQMKTFSYLSPSFFSFLTFFLNKNEKTISHIWLLNETYKATDPPYFHMKQTNSSISRLNSRKFFAFQKEKFQSRNFSKLFPPLSEVQIQKTFFLTNSISKNFENFEIDFSNIQKKQKNLFLFQIYTKEVFWLPQENFLISMAQIHEKDLSLKKEKFHLSFQTKKNGLHFGKSSASRMEVERGQIFFYKKENPFFHLVNRQGKKKQIFFNFDGLAKLSNIQNFQKIDIFDQNPKQIQRFDSVQQKLSFSKKRKNKTLSFQKNFEKTLEKRIQNEKFENIQKLFLNVSPIFDVGNQKIKDSKFSFTRKMSFKKKFLFSRISQNQSFTCVPLQNLEVCSSKHHVLSISSFPQTSGSSSKIASSEFLHPQTKKNGQTLSQIFPKSQQLRLLPNFRVFPMPTKHTNKSGFNQNTFFQNKNENFQKNSKLISSSRTLRKNVDSRLDKVQADHFQNVPTFLKKRKIHLKVQSGWLYIPFFSSVRSATPQKKCHTIVEFHKKIIKNGSFFGHDLSFEQNNILSETVILDSSFPFTEPELEFDYVHRNFSIFEKLKNSKMFSVQILQKKTKKQFSFSVQSFQKNKKCRFHSSVHFIERKFGYNLFQKSKFGNLKQHAFQVDSHNFSSSFQGKVSALKRVSNENRKIQKRSFFQFFRPFEYKLVENPKNAMKVFLNFQLQSFSILFSSKSSFELYKKYHSPFLNCQKKGKVFLNQIPEQTQTQKIEFLSNFENMYFLKQKTKNLKNRYFSKIHSFSNFDLFKRKIHQKNRKIKIVSIRGESSPLNHVDFFALECNQKGCKKKNLSSFDSKKETFFCSVQKMKNFSISPNKKRDFSHSFYPIQFLPFVLSFSQSPEKNFFENSFKNVSFPIFVTNPLKNTIEYCICEKKAPFLDQRFTLIPLFENFVKTSSFWLNKDKMTFVFSFEKLKTNFMNFEFFQRENFKNSKTTFFQNSIFKNSQQFYGSTKTLSPYEGEILPMVTHEMNWWEKASKISTLQKLEKLFTIVTKKDLFSVQFVEPCRDENTQKTEPNQQNIEKTFSFFENKLKTKQQNLRKLYESVLSSQKKFSLNNFVGSSSPAPTSTGKETSKSVKINNSFPIFTSFGKNSKNELQTKTTKISSFVTKYENKVYTFQNLTIGYPTVSKIPRVGNFVFYGDCFFDCAIRKPGQIVHLSSKRMTLRRGQPFLVSLNGILHFSKIPYIRKNVPIVTLPYQTVQAGDIVQGIPKVEQFFEARTTIQGRLFVSSLPILLKGIFERYKVLLPLEQATRQSFLKIQQIIVDGVQRVYRSQGVSITDKHLEIVVRQMTTKVQILHGAQTGFFPGELVNLDLVERLNQFLMVKIRYEPVILGITRASLEVDSFLSASSFQQTTKILSLAAISHKKDFLKGLKENLLVGNLIPAGTGYFTLTKTR